jgi:hypothetical protein
VRSDGVCPDCGGPIRHATHAATRQAILLAPQAVLGGRYGVVDWRHTSDAARSVPVVAVNPKRSSTPTRYEPHQCG